MIGFFHCVFHFHALIIFLKKLLLFLKHVLKAEKGISFIKSQPLTNIFFNILCDEIRNTLEKFQLHIEVWGWYWTKVRSLELWAELTMYSVEHRFYLKQILTDKPICSVLNIGKIFSQKWMKWIFHSWKKLIVFVASGKIPPFRFHIATDS